MLQTIQLHDREGLPRRSGIYIVRAPDETCLYVGQSTNLRERWLNDRHHRYPQAVNHQAYLQYFICEESELDTIETQMIELLKPLWNYTTSDSPGETYPLGKKHWQVYESILESPMTLIQQNLNARNAIGLLENKGNLANSISLRVALEEQGYYLIDGIFIKYLIKHRTYCFQRSKNMGRLMFEIN